jgi:mono/diheme cytochrome c family protein
MGTRRASSVLLGASGRFRAVPLALSTGHAVGLALVAGTMVVFALLSALVIPRRWPQYPGRGLNWFIAGTLVLFVSTLAAVEVFAKEAEEEVAVSETTTETGATKTEGTTTGEAQPPPPPTAAKGDPAAGKAAFAAQGCGGCHAFSAAGTTASVGPDLDEALQGKDAEFVRESIVDPNKVIASGYGPGIMPQDFGQKLSPKQLDDLVAFLTQSQ